MKIVLGLVVAVGMSFTFFVNIPTFAEKPATLSVTMKPLMDDEALDRMIYEILMNDYRARDHHLKSLGIPEDVRVRLLDPSIVSSEV